MLGLPLALQLVIPAPDSLTLTRFQWARFTVDSARPADSISRTVVQVVARIRSIAAELRQAAREMAAQQHTNLTMSQVIRQLVHTWRQSAQRAE